jgi:hypothetical protein
LFFCNIMFFLTSCRDTRTAESTIGTAGSAINNNDLETFSATLMNPALRDWGHSEGLQTLRARKPQREPQLLSLVLFRKESCGHNSCVHRFYEGKIGLKAEGTPDEVLLTLWVLCRKVAKHRECWIYDIQL